MSKTRKVFSTFLGSIPILCYIYLLTHFCLCKLKEGTPFRLLLLICVTKPRVGPPAAANSQLRWHWSAAKQMTLMGYAPPWRTGSLAGKPELLHGLQIRGFTEQKSPVIMSKFRVMGCANWSVLMQALAIWYIQLLVASWSTWLWPGGLSVPALLWLLRRANLIFFN